MPLVYWPRSAKPQGEEAMKVDEFLAEARTALETQEHEAVAGRRPTTTWR